MKTSHHFLAVLLAVLLCLSLTACGDSSDDVTGDDWRTSGVVAAEGTITHEGEGSVKVLVTVGPESAAFYRDEPEQELFDSVSFPVTVEDANDDGTGFDISFDDITGDGESDVVVTFQHADMSTTQMVWFWDADERYVFEPDYSCFHENGVQTDLTDTPYFSDNGLQINAAVNTGTYLLENGVACYSGLGDGYERNDCYWEVIKHSDQSHDGIREIQFDAICYIPESSIPYFTEQYITNTDSELYDYYTGMWFTAATMRHTGNKFYFISPEELRIPDYLVDETLEPTHTPYEEVSSLEDSLPKLDVLYMTRVQKERFFNEEDYIRLKDTYILNREKLQLAKEDMPVLHPLPRVDEIAYDVDDDSRAAYFQQVQNGKYMRMALILSLLGIEDPQTGEKILELGES